MRFFWMLLTITMFAASLNLIFSKGIEIVLLLIIMDSIVLWVSLELERKGNEEGILLEKIENMERLISDLFDKVTNKLSTRKNEKKDLVEWLNKF